MSNLATVQGIYEAFGKGDVPAILEVLAEAVEWESWDDVRLRHYTDTAKHIAAFGGQT